MNLKKTLKNIMYLHQKYNVLASKAVEIEASKNNFFYDISRKTFLLIYIFIHFILSYIFNYLIQQLNSALLPIDILTISFLLSSPDQQKRFPRNITVHTKNYF